MTFFDLGVPLLERAVRQLVEAIYGRIRQAWDSCPWFGEIGFLGIWIQGFGLLKGRRIGLFTSTFKRRIGFIMSRQFRFAPSLHFTAIVLALIVVAPSLSAQDDDARFSAVFLDAATPGTVAASTTAQLAVQWTGAASARLSAWIDFDGDGEWLDSERVVIGEVLDEDVNILEVTMQRASERIPVYFFVFNEKIMSTPRNNRGRNAPGQILFLEGVPVSGHLECEVYGGDSQAV